MTENRNPGAGEQGAASERITPYLDLSLTRSTKDAAKAGLFLAILALVLVMVFFAWERNSLMQTQARLDAMSGAYEQRMASVEERLGTMENLPEAVRRAYVDGALREMSARLGGLETQVQGEEQKAKLAEIARLLDELAAGQAK